MFIYLVTNKLNGKEYVGQTRRSNPRKRWMGHKHEAYSFKDTMPVHRAIRKYGFENFSFEILETVDRVEQLPERESHYINLRNTFVPNGYNLLCYDDKGNFVKHPSVLKKHSHMMQGNRSSKTAKYIGVTRGNAVKTTTFQVKIQKANNIYSAVFHTEEDAVSAYDIMALYLYGSTAKLNFPEKIDKYSLEDILNAVSSFIYKDNQDYKHVWWEANEQKWIAVIKVNGKPKRRFFTDQIEAVEHIDLVKYYYLDVPVNELAFPEKIDKYLSINKESLFKREGRAGSYRWVYNATNKSGYNACFHYQGKRVWVGYFTDPKIAYEAVIAKRQELGMSIV